MTFRFIAKWWHADLRQAICMQIFVKIKVCKSSSRHVVTLSKGKPGPRIQLGVARQSFPWLSLPCYVRGLLSHQRDHGSHGSSVRGQ